MFRLRDWKLSADALKVATARQTATTTTTAVKKKNSSSAPHAPRICYHIIYHNTGFFSPTATRIYIQKNKENFSFQPTLFRTRTTKQKQEEQEATLEENFPKVRHQLGRPPLERALNYDWSIVCMWYVQQSGYN